MTEAPAWHAYARHVLLWLVAIALIFCAWELLLLATGLPAYVIPTPGATMRR
jgi:ABC-type nitrate/sulfonate/bicarbonate transport system permease component